MNIYYGGTFDPPTKAHIEIIRRLIGNANDNLIVGVTDQKWGSVKSVWNDRNRPVFSFEQRCKLLRLALNCQGVRAVPIVKQTDRTWRFLTLDMTEPIDAIVVGQDEWESLNRLEWQFSSLLMERYMFIVMPRGNGISSSQVREWIVGQHRNYDGRMAQYIDEPVYEQAMKFYDERNNIETNGDEE